jgi:hypothetical protein
MCPEYGVTYVSGRTLTFLHIFDVYSLYIKIISAAN